MTFSTDTANMRFHVVNERHRRYCPMICTTDKPSTSSGRVLHDHDLAEAISSSVAVCYARCQSARTRHVNLDEAMNDDSDQNASASSQFPEPTRFDPPRTGPLRTLQTQCARRTYSPRNLQRTESRSGRGGQPAREEPDDQHHEYG